MGWVPGRGRPSAGGSEAVGGRVQEVRDGRGGGLFVGPSFVGGVSILCYTHCFMFLSESPTLTGSCLAPKGILCVRTEDPDGNASSQPQLSVPLSDGECNDATGTSGWEGRETYGSGVTAIYV